MAQYHFPPIEFLKDSTEASKFQRLEYVQRLKDKLDEMFASFHVNARVVDYHYNKFAILMKVKLGPDASVKTIRNLRPEIGLYMAGPVEFLDATEGDSLITIAIKNIQRPIVPLKEVIQSAAFQKAASPVTVAAGIDLLGKAFVFDIAKMPNLLVAGVTGSGKSVFLHDIILSILYKAHPDDVKLLLFDMKNIEFPLLNGIPHMLQDTITDTDTGLEVLRWLQNEKSDRLYRMARIKAANIDQYNKMSSSKMYRIVVIVDEFMEYIRRNDRNDRYESERIDLFNAALEDLVKDSAATGIHLILATQRPTDDVITPQIKKMLPCRVAFYVVDKRESKIVLNRYGAERLAGHGDMIFTRSDSDTGVHAQAAFVSYDEVDKIIDFARRESGLFGTEPILKDN